MQFAVADPRFQTMLFTAMFLVALLLSARKARRTEAFPPSLTRELKGFAILVIIFGHIGFALSKDNAFLQPLSILAGVGVNLFLFLSGLGLAISQEKSNQTPGEFYRHRARHLLVPLWIVLSLLFIADALVLQRSYPLGTVLGSYLGFYPSAKMFTDLNAPLWYLTFLFSYYAAFPFLYWKRQPYVSALLVLAFSILFCAAMYPLVGSTFWLYVIHCNAFPLGMLAAHLLKRVPKRPIAELVWSPVRYVVALGLAAAVAYAAVHSGVGLWYEQPVSVMTMLSIIAIFVLVPVRFGLFDLFGKYSYEIYLFHWPLLYRYDVLYANLPASVATALWLAAFLALGWALWCVSNRFGEEGHGRVQPVDGLVGK